MISYSEYLAYVEEAKNYKTYREFLAEIGYPFNCPYTAEGLVKFCKIIFAVSQMDYNALSDLSVANNRNAFARSRNLPIPTYKDWAGQKCKSPEYVVELLGYSMLGDLPLEKEYKSIVNEWRDIIEVLKNNDGWTF